MVYVAYSLAWPAVRAETLLHLQMLWFAAFWRYLSPGIWLQCIQKAMIALFPNVQPRNRERCFNCLFDCWVVPALAERILRASRSWGLHAAQTRSHASYVWWNACAHVGLVHVGHVNYMGHVHGKVLMPRCQKLMQFCVWELVWLHESAVRATSCTSNLNL